MQVVHRNCLWTAGVGQHEEQAHRLHAPGIPDQNAISQQTKISASKWGTEDTGKYYNTNRTFSFHALCIPSGLSFL